MPVVPVMAAKWRQKCLSFKLATEPFPLLAHCFPPLMFLSVRIIGGKSRGGRLSYRQACPFRKNSSWMGKS